MNYLFWSAVGYLSGGVMYAYWIPRIIWGKDICRLSDDGNPGAANAFKHAGVPAGSMVIVFELLKAFVPVFFASRVLDVNNWLFLPVMAAPVAGHAFPLLFRQGGGKAIAASFGVMLGLYPEIRPLLLLAAFYLLFSVVVKVNPHFYRSVLTFVFFSGFAFVFLEEKVICAGCLVISVMVVTRHLMKYNGERLRIDLLPWGDVLGKTKKDADRRREDGGV